MRIAVYYVYMGDGQRGGVIPDIPLGSTFDFYYFTNNKALYDQLQTHPKFKARWVDVETKTPSEANLECKRLKALPHTDPELNSYPFTLYLDTKLSFNETQWGVNLTEELVLQNMKDCAHMALFEHPHNSDVRQDYKEAMGQLRYAQEANKIDRFMHTTHVGPVDKYFQTGYIFRANTPTTKEMNELSFSYIQQCGAMCQISFNYVYERYQAYIKSANRKIRDMFRKSGSSIYIPEKFCNGTDHVETPVRYFPNFITPEWCDRLVDLCESKGLSAGTTFGGASTVRQSDINWLAESEDTVLFDRVMDSAHKTNMWEYEIWGFSDAAQYTVYDSSKHDNAHYSSHKDTGPGHHHRKLSFVILLSDPNEFEGGQLQVEHEPGTVNFASKGSAVIFPSINHHSVSRVTKGVRRSLVFWIAGPKLR